MSQNRNKRARTEDESTPAEVADVWLCAALRGFFGGMKHAKQKDLTREMLLSYAIQNGDVVPVTLFTVTVEPLAGDIFDVNMEEQQNSVKQLRLLIQQSKARLFPHRHSFYCRRVARLKRRASSR